MTLIVHIVTVSVCISIYNVFIAYHGMIHTFLKKHTFLKTVVKTVEK
jgi:hypothetical protein